MAQPLPADEGFVDDDVAPSPALLEEPSVDEVDEGAPQTRDPLKLYVHQIGGGRLLTRDEERELHAARTRGTRQPSDA